MEVSRKGLVLGHTGRFKNDSLPVVFAFIRHQPKKKYIPAHPPLIKKLLRVLLLQVNKNTINL